MSHLHNVYDTDVHFIIDTKTRKIIKQMEKCSLVQNDHNSERFTFEMPRVIEGHDVSLCDKIEIHYINLSSNSQNKNTDVYIVDDVTVSTSLNDTVIFSWLISGNATQYAGTLSFLIRFVCLTDEIIDYAWHTEIYKSITISDGMNNSEAVVEEYSDILTKWEKELGSANVIVSLEQTQTSVEDNGINIWTATFHDGSTRTLEVRNGSKGSQGIQGPPGIKGDTGTGFTISKTYSSVDEMIANYNTDDVPMYGFALIDTGNVEDEDNAKLYIKEETGYTYLTDLSGSQGIKGEDGYTPIKEVDYFTEADKVEMVDRVLEALPTWTGGSY